jgi:hypothetical protein
MTLSTCDECVELKTNSKVGESPEIEAAFTLDNHPFIRYHPFID